MTYEANPYVEASRTAQRLIAEASPFLATVVSTTGGFVSIRRLGAQAVEGPYPATVGLAAGVSAADLVLVLKAGSTLVVLAKVEGDPASDGSFDLRVTGNINFTGNLDGSGTSDFWARNVTAEGTLWHQGAQAAFYSAVPINKPTVTGSRGGNAALASLLTALANLGLIANNTSP